MKKLLVVVIALVGFTVARSNPIVPPSVWISELTFAADGSWVLEIQGFDFPSWFVLDSIVIKSASGKAKVKRIQFEGNDRIMVVRNDSLESDLVIRQAGDSLRLDCYSERFYFNNEYIPPFVFGDFATAQVVSPPTNQSIAGAPGYQYLQEYSLDNSPTIGFYNDTTGMCGSLTGKIYDVSANLVTSSDYVFYSNSFLDMKSSTDGSYHCRILSRKSTISTLSVYYKPTRGWINIPVETIRFSGKPDSLIVADIRLKKDLLTALDEIENEQGSMLQLFPNPLKGRTLHYIFLLPVHSSECFLELSNLRGQRIATYRVTDNGGQVELPASISLGVYFARLVVNNRRFEPTKILIAD